MLDTRWERLWDVTSLPAPQDFDPDNDLHAEELADHLWRRFRRAGDSEAYAMLLGFMRPRLRRIARRLAARALHAGGECGPPLPGATGSRVDGPGPRVDGAQTAGASPVDRLGDELLALLGRWLYLSGRARPLVDAAPNAGADLRFTVQARGFMQLELQQRAERIRRAG